MLRSKYQSENVSSGGKKMANDAMLEKLYFELASESRLAILRELQRENLKMQEIARRLDVTATEAFRQLERLSAALLVQRQSDGTFALAEYGKLVLQLSTTFEFTCTHKEYLSTHDVMRLPTQFLNRIGELSKANLVLDTIQNLNAAERAFIEAEEFGWGIAEGTVPEHMAPIMLGKAKDGIDLRFLIPENRLLAEGKMPATPRNLQARSLKDIPAIVVITEKTAAVCFRQLDGRVDYAGFFGADPTFHGWVKDLFVYYWDKAKSA
jgi:predicted transcriptional regulator